MIQLEFKFDTPKRTPRKLLTLSWAISFQDDDRSVVLDWFELKKYLRRKELIQLIRTVREGHTYLTFPNNPVIWTVEGF